MTFTFILAQSKCFINVLSKNKFCGIKLDSVRECQVWREEIILVYGIRYPSPSPAHLMHSSVVTEGDEGEGGESVM